MYEESIFEKNQMFYKLKAETMSSGMVWKASALHPGKQRTVTYFNSSMYNNKNNKNKQINCLMVEDRRKST